MPAPKVSIIIPCYNVEPFLAECLQSVLSQTLSEIEVICVNDGSTDGTLQILQQYRQKDSRITVIDQENQGVAMARNVALRHAAGEFIAFMDSDDFYPNAHTLELLYSKAIGSGTLICGGSLSHYYHYDKTVVTHFGGNYAKFTLTKEGVTPYRDYQFDFGFYRFLYKRELLLENNISFPLYERFEDPPFFVRAMIAAGSFYAVPDDVYRYRFGRESASSVWSNIKVHHTLLGSLDNLTLSAQHHLSQLHALTVSRIEEGPIKVPLINALRSGDREAFMLLNKVNAAICPALLQEAGVQLDEHGHYLLRGYENWLTVSSLEEGNAKMVPVVMATDENYAVPASVTIASLLCNAAPETRYDIYILIPGSFPSVSRLLLQQFEQRYPGCRINFLEVTETFEHGYLDYAHLTKVSFYRLLIPALLPQYSKCIYLDTDLVVNTDLAKLYRTDMEGFYIAGVRDAEYRYFIEKIACEAKIQNLPNLDDYVNAGILVMNLDELRKHGLQKTFVELSATFNDQDILNICCCNNIKMLPLTFNVPALLVCHENGRYRLAEERAYVYPEDEQNAAMQSPAIIHYITSEKPWSTPNSPLSEYWQKYVPYSTFYFEPLFYPIKASELQTHQQCQSLKAENMKLKKMNAQRKKTVVALKRQLAAVRHSASYRIGRMITYIPRKLRGGIRCCREHGFSYTVKRAFTRIFRKGK